MIVVFGSLNIDMLMRVERLPQPGETVKCPYYDWVPGGKGANQAVAASRAMGGVKVAMVGKVGDDGFGTRCLNNLKKEGINTSGIGLSALPTGCASVIFDRSGENQIIVASGANGDATADQVPNEILGEGNVILMQMEVRADENWALIQRAGAKGATTILNLAPALAVPKYALEALDYLIVNQIEARQIADKLGLHIEDDAMKLAHALAKNCSLTCIITIGSKGSVAAKGDQGWRMPALDLPEIVDTTGSGDAFCGAFAAAIHMKKPINEALKRASIAGSLACTKIGAQAGLPHDGDIDGYLSSVADAAVEAL